MMKHRVIAVIGGAALAGTLAIGPALAAPGDNGEGVGDCVAGTLYGNTTNPRPEGNGVLPSQSPGPWVNNEDDRGLSAGDVHQIAHETFGAPAGNYTGREVNDFICTFP
jgi:hypothetical protein